LIGGPLLPIQLPLDVIIPEVLFRDPVLQTAIFDLRIIILSVYLLLLADAFLDVDPQLLALSLEPIGVISEEINVRVPASHHLSECAYLLDQVCALPP
jgi:hypothetical protein